METCDSRRSPVPAFHALIDCPLIANTGFSVWASVSCAPEDALGTGFGTLAAGNCLLRKERQDPALKLNYESWFELD